MAKRVCLLFDFDGVIVDSYDAVLKIVQSKKDITSAEYKRRFLKPIAEGTKKLSAQALKDYFETYLQRMKSMPLVPEIDELILTLAKHYQLFIISSTTNRPINTFLKNYGLTDAITEVLGFDVEPDKVEKINYVLKTYQYRKEETLFITDTVGDVEEGRVCGLKTVAVTWGYHDRPTLERTKPWKTVDSPAELAQAIEEFTASVTM